MPAALLLALAGCGPTPDAAPVRNDAGAALERAALAAGLVAAGGDPVGLYASETDRVCIVPATAGFRIGATTDFADGQGCSARGTASSDTAGTALQVRFGDDCRFEARIESGRVLFPVLLPAACDASCRGRASFAALSAERASASVSEASTMRDRAGKTPCAS